MPTVEITTNPDCPVCAELKRELEILRPLAIHSSIDGTPLYYREAYEIAQQAIVNLKSEILMLRSLNMIGMRSHNEE